MLLTASSMTTCIDYNQLALDADQPFLYSHVNGEGEGIYNVEHEGKLFRVYVVVYNFGKGSAVTFSERRI